LLRRRELTEFLYSRASLFDLPSTVDGPRG